MRDQKDNTPKVVNTTQSNGIMDTVNHVNPCQRIIIEQCQFCQTMLIPSEIANHERSCAVRKQTQSPPDKKVIYCGVCQKVVFESEFKTHAKICQELRRRQITANKTPSIQSPPKKKIFFCGYCNQVLLESECKTHAKICHKLRRQMRANATTNIHDALAYIQCQFCPGFFFSDKLRNHEQSCTKRKRKQGPSEEKISSCGYCNEMHGQVCPELRKQKVDEQKHQFLTNGKSHKQSYKCQYCKMEIGNSWVLEIHEQVCKELYNITSGNKGTLLNSFIIDREAREIMYLVASVRPFVCLIVCALLLERFDLRP